MYTETFSKKLIKAREDIGYTQLQASEMLGIARSTLSNYEIGRTEPSIELLGKIIDLYEKPAQWFLNTEK